MSDFTNDYDETKPIDKTKFCAQPGHVRTAKADIAERLKDFFHGFITGETVKGIKYLLFRQEAGDPTGVEDCLHEYAKEAGGEAEKFRRSEEGAVYQVTKKGRGNLDNAVASNDTFIKGRNAADNADVGVIKVGTSNQPVLGTGVETISDAAPTGDKNVANKKYVDDMSTADRARANHTGTQAPATIDPQGAGSGFDSDTVDSLHAADIPHELGTWAAATVGAATQATTDGFLVGYAQSAGGGPVITIKTDASNPPTTIRAKGHTINDASSHTLMCPVKKNDYYLITLTNATGTFYWIPLS